MSHTVTVGRRLIPLEQIALVEPFEPSPDNPLRTDREFKSRIVLLNRDSVLAETEVAPFTKEHGFRFLAEDGVATNPTVHLSVEAFAPTEGFQPSKPYQSRLVWRDFEGNTQSKLLLSAPEQVLALAVRGEEPEPESPEDGSRSIQKTNSTSRRRPRRRVASKAPSPI